METFLVNFQSNLVSQSVFVMIICTQVKKKTHKVDSNTVSAI